MVTVHGVEKTHVGYVTAMVSVYRAPQMQGSGHAVVLQYYKCPVTQQVRCPVNAYKK